MIYAIMITRSLSFICIPPFSVWGRERERERERKREREREVKDLCIRVTIGLLLFALHNVSWQFNLINNNETSESTTKTTML